MAPERKGKAAPKEKGEKKKKDPNAPKKPLSAYMFFSKDAREEVKKDNDGASFGEIGKLLGNKWTTLDEEARKPYVDMAARDKERYAQEQAAYEAEGGGGGGEATEKPAKKTRAPKKKKAAEKEEEDEDEKEEEVVDDEE